MIEKLLKYSYWIFIILAMLSVLEVLLKHKKSFVSLWFLFDVVAGILIIRFSTDPYALIAVIIMFLSLVAYIIYSCFKKEDAKPADKPSAEEKK